MQPSLISIVVPVYNEQDSLEALTREVFNVADANGYSVRILFVDDGSRDGSWTKIHQLAGADNRIGGLRFRRNQGKAAALMAGFAAAEGDLVFMMDSDGQDPPVEMPRFLQKMHEGYDVVSGWKQRRHDPWHKVYPSRVFNKMISFLTGVRLHDHVCGFKCFRPEVLREIRIHGEQHRFLGVLSAAKGFRVAEIPTLHRPRTTGVSKYGFTRFAKGLLDLITVWVLTRYRWRPQHVIGMSGLLLLIALAVVAPVALIILTAQQFSNHPTTPAQAAMLYMLLLFLPVVGFAFTLIAIGLVAELIIASQPVSELYTVVERIGCCAPEVLNADRV